MNEVLYKVPDDFKNAVVGFYIFGWLFLGTVFKIQQINRV